MTDQASTALREAEIAAILETAVDAVIVIDTRGTILRFNPAAERMFGHRRDVVLGDNVARLMPPHTASEHGHYLARYLETHEPRIIGRGREVTASRANGETFPVYLAVSEFKSEEGDVFFAGILRDISKERKARQELERTHQELLSAHRNLADRQQQLLQAEKLSSIGLLASGVAHEINNPLAGIMTCIRALEGGELTEKRRKEYFDTVSDGLRRIHDTVRGLLDFARQNGGHRETIDVSFLVGECLRLLTPAINKKSLTMRNNVASEARMFADRAQVLQSLVNVMLNAVYASPARSAINVSSIEDKTMTGIRIRDYGSGIPDDIRHRIFDPFFSTKAEGEGTGLGLSVTLGLIESNDGRIEIQTPSDGIGTAITLWLPTDPSESP